MCYLTTFLQFWFNYLFINFTLLFKLWLAILVMMACFRFSIVLSELFKYFQFLQSLVQIIQLRFLFYYVNFIFFYSILSNFIFLVIWMESMLINYFIINMFFMNFFILFCFSFVLINFYWLSLVDRVHYLKYFNGSIQRIILM